MLKMYDDRRVFRLLLNYIYVKKRILLNIQENSFSKY